MSGLIPPAPRAELRTIDIAPPQHDVAEPKDAPAPTQPGPAAAAAAERRALRDSEYDARLTPDRLVVEKDEEAGRFVQTFINVQTKETVLRYPSEAQLAYSRAVAAYLRAMSES